MRPSALCLALFTFVAVVAAQQLDDLGKKTIATGNSPVAELLRTWWSEKTAAGNEGDWYDNRDAGHSDLHMAPYPQLQRVVYSEDDIKARRHWAAARIVRPEVTIGNSSTSAPPTDSGSNPRSAYTSPIGLKLLHAQYVGNNIYIYPEHRDHDPGHNGAGDGFGDLYPTNTPYLFISQGSSGSDQPFMRAIPYVLAAFRPEVKKKLTETGLLMPTVQMLFRRTNRRLKSPDEYFTPAAHPTVFEGSWVDDLALVKAAHEIRVDKIPPMIGLKVLAEDRFEPGKDYFDPASESFGDTPCVIARVWRAAAGIRRMIVSAEASFDVNKRPLTYKWVVLRGDADRIKIEPRNKESSVVELTVRYHERRPIAPGSELASNRVDIGVFVDNGVYPSAPGFVTFHSLDSEDRLHDDKGRIREIVYGAGEIAYGVSDFRRWLARVQEPDLAALLGLDDAERKRLAEAVPKLEVLSDELKSASEAQKAADANRAKAIEEAKKDPSLEGARKTAEAESQAAAKRTQEKQRALDRFLDDRSHPLSLRELVLRRFRETARSGDFRARFAKVKLDPTTTGARQALQAGDDELASLGFDFKAEPSSEFGRTVRERHQAVALSRLFQGSLDAQFRLNYVDRRLTLPKNWRDVYRYDDDGNLLGWTRHAGKTATDFSAQGFIVVEKDARGRCTVGRAVEYRIDGKAPAATTIQPIATETVVTIRYADDRDRVGTIERKESRPK